MHHLFRIKDWNLKNGKMLKRLIIILCIATGCMCLYATEVGGLAFRSSEELINQRTSATFDLAKLGIKGSFTAKFDLSIWSPDKFGYILTYILPSGKVINLVHVHFRNNTNSQIELTIPAENKAAIISVPKKELGKNHWIPVALDFDFENDSVSLHCNNQQTALSTSLENDKKNGEIYFGRSPQNIDVVRMAIRNVRLNSENGNKSYYMPLAQKEGLKIFDESGKKVGEVENPCWLISEHLAWVELNNTISHYNSGVAYDTKRNQILIFSSDSVIHYDINDQIFKYSYLQHKTNIEKFYREAIYGHANDVSLVYHYGNSELGDYVVMRHNQNSEENIVEIKKSIGKKHHHAALYNDSDSAIYIFGGYGSFSYYNKLTRFSPQTASWIDIPLSGDTITPRFFTSMCFSSVPDEVFVFGGFGNPSGKQEMGGYHVYDLYTLNLKTGHCKRLADFSNKVQDKFVVLNQMVFDEKNQELYVLGFTHHEVSARLQLYRISLKDYTIKKVADSMPMMSEKIQSNAFLFFDKENAQLICVIKEWFNETEARLKINSLSFPPMNESDVLDNSSRSYTVVILIVSVIVVMLLILFIILKNKKREKNDSLSDTFDNKADLHEEKEKRIITAKPNSIYTFGGFVVFDRKGKDITYRLSVRLKHFFTLLLLSSYSEREGLNSQEICAILWPDKDLSSAQNLRGVTANQLRAILADLDGVVMEKSQSGKWMIQINQPAFCDYVYIIQSLTDVKSVELNEVLSLLSNGTFLPLIQTGWVDKFKSNFESIILDSLPKIISSLVERNELSQLVRLSTVLLIYEPLNDEYMAMKLCALLKLGKTSSARQSFENYKAEYKNSYGEAFAYEMKAFIDRYCKIRI